MSKVVVTLLSVLLILLTLLFLTWTILSFTYYEIPPTKESITQISSSQASNPEDQKRFDIPSTPGQGQDPAATPSNFFTEVPGLPRRETVIPVKLPPASEFSVETMENLWFDDQDSENTENRLSGDTQPTGPRRRAHYDSGHFRDRGAQIWDPHPQYRFLAFGQVFHLILSPADDFVSPVLRVTTHESNFTWREDPVTGASGNLCFYRGFVSGDSDSSVAVSLCHGMTGHIRTQNGSFFIEPLGPWTGPHAPLAHAFYQTGPIPFVNLHDPMSKDHDDGTTFTGQQELILHNVLPETKSGNGESSGGGRRKKRSMSKERYVELMVVTDSTMAAYHGENLKHYVLTLLSIVALVYKDASIGNPVNIALVKFHVLRDKDFTWKNRATDNLRGTRPDGSAFGISASEMLRNFCKWQKEHNNMDDTSPDHHDTALLLTRETICRNPWLYKCDTLGLAELGTMCDLYASCAIVQDNGLSAAFTIAHELGHVLNMPHDDDTKCHSFKSGLLPNVQAHYVMSRMLDHNTYPWAWSKCSRHYLTEFLDAGHGYCLEDAPRDNLLEAETSLTPGRNRPQPGEIFSEDRQCELVFGSQSQLCSYMPVCRRLWCTTGESGEEEGCRTQHMPWADGTPCARDKWCQRGACVMRDLDKLRKVDGGWGQWQAFGECSRSCGGGVRRSIRECDNPSPANGGKYCIGHRVRYESCNTHECSNDHRDFRGDQCGEFNQDNFNIQGLPKNVEWVPKYAGISAKDRCKLFCRVHGSSAYYLLKEKVIDGTPCGPDTFDICVNGECRLAGCDRKLSSTKALDICGVCGGDNGSCQMQSGSYNESKYGYNPVIRIPAGASSVDIRQTGFNGSARDDNYLAILDPGTKEQYVLNGHFIVSMFRKTVHAAGTVLEYSGSDSVVERINSSRPLKSDLIVQVLSVGKLHPPDIRYQYVISLNRSQTFQWADSDRWSTCSSLCHGTRHREPICLRNRNQEVEPRLCPGSPPQPTESACNDNCDLRWKVIDSSPCSVSCGTGRRNLMVRCIRQFNANFSVVSDTFCDHGQKPAEIEACTETCNKPKWKYSPWSDCSSRCGEGTQSRQSTCVDSFDNVVDSGHCERLEDPQTTKKCSKNAPCGKWRVEQWSPCSVSCGKGITKALYACHQAHPGGAILPHDFCHNDPTPVVERACEGPPCVQWDVEDWSPCSKTCGLGMMTRRVFCVGTKEREVVEETFCVLNNLLKPEHEKVCQVEDCPATTTISTTSTTTSSPDRTRNSIPSSRKFSKYGHVSFGLGNPKYRHGEVDNSIDALAYDIDFPRSSPLVSESNQRIKWRPEPWTECYTDHYGKRIRSRRVNCVLGNQQVDDAQCSRAKPAVTQECRNQTVWQTGAWDKCNSTICEEGYENRKVECMSVSDRTVLPDSDCRGETPIRLRPCSGKCAAYGSVSPRSRSNRGFGSASIWRTGSWSKCSQLCGGGFKLRQVICQFENGSRSNDCELRLKPPNNGTCGTEPCPIWHTGSWSECTAECGGGLQDRRVQCRDSTGHNFPDHICSNALKPPGTQHCNEEVCANENEMKVSVRHRWVTGPWSNCSKHCGKGVKKRRVDCMEVVFDLQQRREAIVNETLCNKIPKPKAERACAKFPCPHQWVTTKWSECSIPCGYGIQQRSVTCHRVNKFGWVDPDPLSSGCEGLEKPKEYSYCYHSDCNSPYKWHTESWTQCPTNRCGKQVRQKRRVYCARKTDGLRVGGHFCPKNHKPNRKRKCDIKSCLPTTCAEYKARNLRATVDGNFILFVGGRNMTIYCSRMGTSEPVEYLTLPDENYSEIYSKRLVRPETCPQHGERMESCDCIEDSNRRSGLTIFHKVRLNVTNLKVDTEDFQYTTQVSGSPIGFGDSGDCYSSVSCPQGSFSINLQGTRFAVSPATSWISQGHKATMWIKKSDDSVRVTGKCGGYCGTCSPNRFIGLKLQVAVT